MIAAAGTIALALAVRGEDKGPRVLRAADGSFAMVVPAGWSAASATELRAVGGSPVAVLRRADRRGLVVVRRLPALRASTRPLARDLAQQLARRLPGLRPVASRTIGLRSGPAFVATFVRPSAGTVHSLAVVPRGGRTFTLDAVLAGDAADVAAQTGAMVRSFDTP